MDSTEILKQIKEALLYIEFSDEEATRQINELSELISLAIYGKISELEGSAEPVKIEEAIKGYPKDKLSAITLEVSNPIINDYFAEVATDLPEEKKQAFMSQLNTIKMK